MEYRYESGNATEFSVGMLQKMLLPIAVFETNGVVPICHLQTQEEVDDFERRVQMENDESWKGQDVEVDHINPQHYKDYLVVEDDEELHVVLQWFETQQYKPYFRHNPKALVMTALVFADKYWSRLGQKDDEVQEMMKGLWYTKFATAFAKNGYKPIWIKDIDAILGG